MDPTLTWPYDQAHIAHADLQMRVRYLSSSDSAHSSRCGRGAGPSMRSAGGCMSAKGETWNESETYRDAWTLRRVRRVTMAGLYNQTPTYHTNVGFTADGEFLIFASAREGRSAVFRCHVPTGDITRLIEPVDGIGGHDEPHIDTEGALGNGRGISGESLCIAPRSRWAIFMAGRALRAVQIETLEERTLIEDIGADRVAGAPSVDPEEAHVVLPVAPGHPEIVAGRRPTRSYMEHYARGGMYLRLLQVPLAGGEVTTVYEESGVNGAHCPHSPTDPDLLLLDRDRPPRFWAGGDGRTNRIWALRLSTGELTELPSRDAACFQEHSAWTWDGRLVLYQGHSAEGGQYIGAVTPDGETAREYGFHKADHYGHVSAAAGRPAVILDGILSSDMLLWLYYDEERPRVEVIARHGSDWGALPGQYPHPHPLSDPTGRWISFNVAHRGRSDVCIVSV